VELLRQALVVDPGDPVDVLGAAAGKLVELAAADEPKVELGRRPGGGEDGLEAVQRDQLPDEQHRERVVRGPARGEEPVLGADERDLDPVVWEARELCEVVGVRTGVGDDEVGGPKGPAIDCRERPRRRRAGPEAAAVRDERVG
jgi:hypothetical protein